MNRLAIALLLALIPTAGLAQTSCGVLSQCPNASTPLSGSELIYLVQQGVSKQTTVGNLVSNSGSVNTGVAGQIAYFASSGNTVSGTNAGIGVLVAIANAPNTAGGLLAPSGALTLGTPVLGGGPGGSPTSGTKSGSTSTFATTTGTLHNGDCVSIDASGNLLDAGGPCTTGGGGGTVTAGSAGQLTYYAGSGTTVSGATTGTGVLTALGVNTGSAGAFVVNGGALGAPSSGSLANATGLPLTTGVTGTLPVANGGTGGTSFSSLTPILGNGAGAFTSGTKNGSTNAFATVSGTTTNGDCARWDGLGNLVDFSCSGGGSGPNIPNASGSANHTTGTIGASATTLTLAATIDFVNGEGIRVNHAGAAFTLNTPTGTGVSPLGTAGSTTYQYKVASIDGAGGVGAATASFQTTTGNATLSTTNLNALYWNAPSGTAPSAYAVYKDISGTYTLIGVAGKNSPSLAYQFYDYGYTGYPLFDWIPSTAPPSSVADALVTTISGGGGTTSLTLGHAATTAATSQGVHHDDSAAIAAVLSSANANLLFPPGTFSVSQPVTVTANQYVAGQYGATIVQSVFPGESIFVLSNSGGNAGTFNRVSNLEFQLVPGTNAISSSGTNGIYQAMVDHLICQGASNGGGVAPTNCVYFDGALDVTIEDVFSDAWSGAVEGISSGYGTPGGETPSITFDETSGAYNNIGVLMNNLMMVSDGGNQISYDSADLTVNNCFNCALSNSYISGGAASPNMVFGGIGIEWEGPSEGLFISNTNILGFSTNFSSDSTTYGSPIQLVVTGGLFDFCQSYCIAINHGSWIQVANTNFVGEGNSPWNFTGNVGIYGGSSFTTGPNVFSANTFVNFSNGSAYAMRFTGTLANTTVSGNQGVTNSTFLSGTAGSGSAFGQNCSGSPSGSFSTFNGVVGHC